MKKAYEKAFIEPRDMIVPHAGNAPITAITISRVTEYPYDCVLKVEYKDGVEIKADKIRLPLGAIYDFRNITAIDLDFDETIRAVSFRDRKQKEFVVILAEASVSNFVYSFFEADRLKAQIRVLLTDREKLHKFLEMF